MTAHRIAQIAAEARDLTGQAQATPGWRPRKALRLWRQASAKWRQAMELAELGTRNGEPQ